MVAAPAAAQSAWHRRDEPAIRFRILHLWQAPEYTRPIRWFLKFNELIVLAKGKFLRTRTTRSRLKRSCFRTSSAASGPDRLLRFRGPSGGGFPGRKSLDAGDDRRGGSVAQRKPGVPVGPLRVGRVPCKSGQGGDPARLGCACRLRGSHRDRRCSAAGRGSFARRGVEIHRKRGQPAAFRTCQPRFCQIHCRIVCSSLAPGGPASGSLVRVAFSF